MKDKDPLWTFMHFNDLELQSGNVKALIRFTLPHAVCPYCRGEDSEGCKCCRESGFVNESVWKITPREIREAALCD
jgi:hypothetical protein